jgi:hypothetical protein
MTRNLIPLVMVFSGLALCLPIAAAAQQEGASLADLARQARERKRAATKPAPVIATLEDVVDCGRDWDCLLDSLDKRKHARLRVPDTIDLSETSGVTITSEVVLEVHDCDEQTCRLTGHTENSTVRVTDSMRARLLLDGWTAEEIDALERAAQARVTPQDEARVNCVFQIDRLRYFLEQRKQGQTADKDWDLADRCEGLDQTVTQPLAEPAP